MKEDKWLKNVGCLHFLLYLPQLYVIHAHVYQRIPEFPKGVKDIKHGYQIIVCRFIDLDIKGAEIQTIVCIVKVIKLFKSCLEILES